MMMMMMMMMLLLLLLMMMLMIMIMIMIMMICHVIPHVNHESPFQVPFHKNQSLTQAGHVPKHVLHLCDVVYKDMFVGMNCVTVCVCGCWDLL